MRKIMPSTVYGIGGFCPGRTGRSCISHTPIRARCQQTQARTGMQSLHCCRFLDAMHRLERNEGSLPRVSRTAIAGLALMNDVELPLREAAPLLIMMVCSEVCVMRGECDCQLCAPSLVLDHVRFLLQVFFIAAIAGSALSLGLMGTQKAPAMEILLIRRTRKGSNGVCDKRPLTQKVETTRERQGGRGKKRGGNLWRRR